MKKLIFCLFASCILLAPLTSSSALMADDFLAVFDSSFDKPYYAGQDGRDAPPEAYPSRRYSPNYLPQYIDTNNRTRPLQAPMAPQAIEKHDSQPISIEVVMPDTTPETVLPPEDAVPVVIGKPSPAAERALIYGHEPFAREDIGVFFTTDGARAPETYVLGPGDLLRVIIFGASQADLLLEINSEGYVRTEETPQIYLKGLTLAQARELMRRRLSQFFSFRPEQFAMTLQTARTVTVNIFGESQHKGSISLSALNTAFNALAAAGGPTEIGSVRNIQHIRGDTRKTLDVYQFLHDPSVQFDFDLLHNDIIFIPVAEKVVDLRGSVRRPKRYELIEGETLNDLIQYAGGINYDTYPDFVQIERIEDGEIMLREYSLAEALSGEVTISLYDGDIVRVRPVQKTFERFVEIQGAVLYPGRYDIRQSATLGTLLERAKLFQNAILDNVYIERTMPDESLHIIPIRWLEIIARGEDVTLERRDRVVVFDEERYTDSARLAVLGYVRAPFERDLSFDAQMSLENAINFAGGLRPNAADTAMLVRRDLLNPQIVEVIRLHLTDQADFILRPGDEVTVYDKETYTDSEMVRVRGSVRRQAEIRLPLGETISIDDILLMAGGLTTTAADIAYVFRTDLTNPDFIEYIQVNVRADRDFRLQPGDRLTVYSQDTYTNVPKASIQGAVNNSVSTAFDPNLGITDLLKMAGGLSEKAQKNRIDVYRLRLSPEKGTQYDRISLEVDSNLVLLPEYEHFRLMPYDQVIVRQQPMFDLERSVQISGQVFYPGHYLLESQRVTLSEIVREAGGLTDRADTRNATLFRSRENIGPVGIDLDRALSRSRRERFDPVIQQGDVITIPEFTNTVYIHIRGTRLGQQSDRDIIPGAAFPTGSRDKVVTFVYEGPRSAKWYIENFAGGFAPNADKNSVTVTNRNGKVTGTTRSMLLFRNYPTVTPGSTISLEFKPPEPPRRSLVGRDR